MRRVRATPDERAPGAMASMMSGIASRRRGRRDTPTTTRNEGFRKRTAYGSWNKRDAGGRADSRARNNAHVTRGSTRCSGLHRMSLNTVERGTQLLILDGLPTLGELRGAAGPPVWRPCARDRRAVAPEDRRITGNEE